MGNVDRVDLFGLNSKLVSMFAYKVFEYKGWFKRFDKLVSQLDPQRLLAGGGPWCADGLRSWVSWIHSDSTSNYNFK